MTTRNSQSNNSNLSSLPLLKRQRSHILFILSDANKGHISPFLEWYQGPYRQAVLKLPGILSLRHYQQHEVDITQGQHVPLPFHYLGWCELSVDGAHAAAGVIEQITALHKEQPTAQVPATWLYYPASEKVGRSPAMIPSMLTLAFANGIPGQEAEFREWYATRHIRHALNVSALVSGQCFERTQLQSPGALEAKFQTIAVYEQEGTPEAILESFASLPEGALDFPMLDLRNSRFAESVYRPL